MTKIQAKDLLEKRGFQIWAVHNMREFQANGQMGNQSLRGLGKRFLSLSLEYP